MGLLYPSSPWYQGLPNASYKTFPNNSHTSGPQNTLSVLFGSQSLDTSEANFGQQPEERQKNVIVRRRCPCSIHEGLQEGFTATLADHVVNPPVCAWGKPEDR